VEAITKRRALRKTLSRREVATILRLHPDSVTRLLAGGLASAVLAWGGHGRLMVFSLALVMRWDFARTCTSGRSGGPCATCRLVLEDCECTGQHLAEKRHGAFETCDDEDCEPQQRFGVGCLISEEDLV
jgi:hypothetical protein